VRRSGVLGEAGLSSNDPGVWLPVDDPGEANRCQGMFFPHYDGLVPEAYPERVYAVGWFELPTSPGARRVEFRVHGLPKAPPACEIETPRGVTVLGLSRNWPAHWTVQHRIGFDGVALVRAGNRQGLVPYRQYTGASGSRRFVVEPPSWRRVNGVVVTAAGEPVAGAAVRIRYSAGQVSTDLGATTDVMGRFSLEFADRGAPTGTVISERRPRLEFRLPPERDIDELRLVVLDPESSLARLTTPR